MCDKEMNVTLKFWQFLKMLETTNDRKHWVHTINQKSDVIYFLSELKSDPESVIIISA